jgi:hypothetical protein
MSHYNMNEIFHKYFSHPLIIGLWLFFFLMLLLCIHLSILWSHLALVFIPILIAPFYEWYAHKFLLHAKLTAKDGWFRRFQIRLHHGHHRDPQNVQLLFAPLSAVIIHLVQTYLLFSLLLWSFKLALVPFTAGVLYYLFYEWMHLAHHVPSYQPKTTLGNKIKRAHMRHHFHNENYNWGITNYFGDIVCGTLKNRNEVKKSTTVRNIEGYHDKIPKAD